MSEGARETPIEKAGVLFVHGMGNHRRGSILRQIGEPLFRWFNGWLSHGAVNAPKALTARNTSYTVPHAGEHGVPAHIEVDVDVQQPDGKVRTIRWLAVDGLWADEIVQPPFAQVASWGLGLAPWMVVRYFRQRTPQSLLIPSLLASLVVVLVFQLAIFLLTLIGVIPQLRAPVARLQLAITGSLGDVMVMVASPLQFSAMTTRMVKTLDWLRREVGPTGKFAIVAHSRCPLTGNGRCARGVARER